MTSAADDLSVTVTHHQGLPVIQVTGALDLATVPTLETALDGILAESSEVVVDLEGVSFLGSTGLNALVRAAQALASRNGVLRVRAASALSRRAIEVTGLGGILNLSDAPVA